MSKLHNRRSGSDRLLLTTRRLFASLLTISIFSLMETCLRGMYPALNDIVDIRGLSTEMIAAAMIFLLGWAIAQLVHRRDEWTLIVVDETYVVFPILLFTLFVLLGTITKHQDWESWLAGLIIAIIATTPLPWIWWRAYRKAKDDDSGDGQRIRFPIDDDSEL